LRRASPTDALTPSWPSSSVALSALSIDVSSSRRACWPWALSPLMTRAVLSVMRSPRVEARKRLSLHGQDALPKLGRYGRAAVLQAIGRGAIVQPDVVNAGGPDRHGAPLGQHRREGVHDVPVVRPYLDRARCPRLGDRGDEFRRETELLRVVRRLRRSAVAAHQGAGGGLQFPAFAPATALKYVR